MHAMVFIINGECDMANLTFKNSAGVDVMSPTIKSIIYANDAGDEYTFGVDSTNNNIFNTFKYKPNGAAEIDYSATATNFMTGGAIAGLLGKLTTIETATNAANLEDKLKSIQDKTDTIPADFTAKVTAIETAINTANLGNKVTAIQTKIDNMVTEAAKLVLENSFKQAITDAGTNGSNWLKNEVKGIVSQPSFDIPTSDEAALNWTW